MCFINEPVALVSAVKVDRIKLKLLLKSKKNFNSTYIEMIFFEFINLYCKIVYFENYLIY